jgi:hypothetical protein
MGGGCFDSVGTFGGAGAFAGAGAGAAALTSDFGTSFRTFSSLILLPLQPQSGEMFIALQRN